MAFNSMGLSEVTKLKKSLLVMRTIGRAADFGSRSCHQKSRKQSRNAIAGAAREVFYASRPGRFPRKFPGSPTNFAVQWAYLFERFPSWTQTFCYREVAEMERQGLAPWIYSIRRPQDEPPQDFPPGMAARVRYLPGESELGEEFRWLKRCDRLPEPLRADEQRLKGGRDKARIQEAGWLGGAMKLAGIGHVHTHFAGIAARTAYWLHRHYGIGFSFTAHANDVFCPPDPDLSLTLEDLIGAARFVVAVSDFGAAQLRERFPQAADKIFRVYNGIDVDAFPLARPVANGPRIVAVGRYIEKKGFGDLVAACALLCDRAVDFDCQIVGEGPLEAELQTAIDRANLRERVALTGPKPLAEVAALLATARVFCPAVRRGSRRRHGQPAHGHRRGDGGRAAGGLDDAGRGAGDGSPIAKPACWSRRVRPTNWPPLWRGCWPSPPRRKRSGRQGANARGRRSTCR